MLMKPFLKWAGNKYRIIAQIKPLLPARGVRLIEPFAGSAAVFLNTNYDHNLICDTNADLIGLYRTLKDEGPAFIEYSSLLFCESNNTPEVYYELRAEFNSCRDPRRKSALFVYLNRHGYNGLCRYSLKGEYNVPFGLYKKPYFPRAEMLGFQQRAEKAVFHEADFRDTMARAHEGDVVYCDPPYVPLTATANFTSYSSGGFTSKDQLELGLLARQLSARGVTVILSNHDTEFVSQAYEGAEFVRFPVQRFISCDGENRGKALEVLALYAGAGND